MLSKIFSTALLVALAAISSAAPIDSSAMGSKHNLYLVTCTKRSAFECPLLILCDQDAAAATKYTAIAYYANGPIETNRLLPSNPTQTATIADPAQPWEGTARTGKLGRSTTVSSNIDGQAASLAKGQIAGVAKMDSEDFVCFRDGQTKVEVSQGLLSDVECVADYWCPSIQV